MRHYRAVMLLALVGVAWLRQGAASADAAPPPDLSKCVFIPKGALGFVVRHAAVSTLSVWTDSSQCADALRAQRGIRLRSTTNGDRFATVSPDPECGPTDCHEFRLAVEKVHDLPTGSTEWHLSGLAHAEDLGSIAFEVVEAIPSRLTIAVRGDQDEGLQVTRDVDKDGKVIAAARDFRELTQVWVLNLAETTLAPHLRSLDLSRYRWEIQDSTWAKDVRFYCSSDLKQRGGYKMDKEAPDPQAKEPPPATQPSTQQSTQPTEDPASEGAEPRWRSTHVGEKDYRSDRCSIRLDRIRFEVRQPLASPLVVTLALLDRDFGEAELIRFPITLATSARVESLPLPLWRTTTVRCVNKRAISADILKWAYHGQTIAIDDDALTGAKCRLRLNYDFSAITPSFNIRAFEPDAPPGDVTGGGSSKERWALLEELAGPQGLKIAVRRGKAVKSEVKTVAPEKGLECPLPSPADAEKETGSYEVTVQLASVNGVHYLEGTLANEGPASAEVGDSSAESIFSATLRPRGQFGTTYPFRLYVTFPLTAATIRLPARARAIHDSQSVTSIEIEGARLGAMAAFELWDYDRDRNLLPFPLQVQTGLSFLRLDDKPVQLAYLLGMTMAFAVFGKETSATSLTIGAFWEHDFTEPLNSLVFTFSLDIFQVLKIN